MSGLATVRERSLEDAKARATAVVRDAAAQAQQLVAAAGAEASALLDAARREGERAAELDTGRDLAGARRRARSLELRAQRAVYEHVRDEVMRSVREDPRYSALLAALSDAARRRLGPGTEVTVDAAGTEGVVAVRRDRRIALTLERIVDRGLARLGARVEEAWL